MFFILPTSNGLWDPLIMLSIWGLIPNAYVYYVGEEGGVWSLKQTEKWLCNMWMFPYNKKISNFWTDGPIFKCHTFLETSECQLYEKGGSPGTTGTPSWPRLILVKVVRNQSKWRNDARGTQRVNSHVCTVVVSVLAKYQFLDIFD